MQTQTQAPTKASSNKPPLKAGKGGPSALAKAPEGPANATNESDTNAHQFKAILAYPQSPDSVRRILSRVHLSLNQWCRDHNIPYQAAKDVMCRKVPNTEWKGNRLKAAIALGLAPIEATQCASHDPAERAIHDLNLKVKELMANGIQLTSLEADTKPLPTIKVFPHPHLENLKPQTTQPVWEVRDGGMIWREWNIPWKGCLLIWVDEIKEAA